MKILVNSISTKKISGGAFQIARNYILKTLEHKDVEWYYVVSVDIDEVIGSSFEDKKDKQYFVFPTQPDFKHTYKYVKKKIANLESHICPDVVYTITAPCYFTFNSPEVMRFTNPWVTHSNEYSWSVLGWKEKIRTWLYCANQRRLMRAAHFFVTQTDTTKKGILRITKEPANHVKVVKNVLPAVFEGMSNEHIVNDEWIDIACVGNPVPHKNFDIIPDVLSELRKRRVTNVRFHTTIPEDHPLLKKILTILESRGLEKNVVNHGRVSQEYLADMYRRCQLCFLPTLLEVFSASTLEAMYFNLPIVATDLPFNTEVLGDSSLYFEPKNAASAAEQFVKMISNIKLQTELKEKMQARLSLYGNYDAHFESIKDFLIQVAENRV